MIQTSDAWPAREDSQQPADECNQDDEQRHEADRPGVEAGLTAVSPQTVAERLDRRRRGQRFRVVRFELHLRSSLVDIEIDRALRSADGSGLCC